MSTIRRLGAGAVSCLLVSALFAASACSDDEDDGKGGAGGKGGTAGRGGSSGGGGNAGTGGGALSCGSTVCPPVNEQAAEFVQACCTQTGNQCGLQTPLTEGCLPLDAPGSLDPTCPTVAVAEGFSMRGCCLPGGTCGVATGQLGLGCVEFASDGQAPTSCTYDPTNTCTNLSEVTCDGPEDCGDSQVCCGRYNGGPYDRFECRTSCDAPDGGNASTQWFEMCHPGQTCGTNGYTCRTSTFLPSYLYRCYTDGTEATNAGNTAADAVNCGSSVCTGSQTCCWQSPGEPYCAAAGACRCKQPSDGGIEAGGNDAGADGAPSDASSNG